MFTKIKYEREETFDGSSHGNFQQHPTDPCNWFPSRVPSVCCRHQLPVDTQDTRWEEEASAMRAQICHISANASAAPSSRTISSATKIQTQTSDRLSCLGKRKENKKYSQEIDDMFSSPSWVFMSHPAVEAKCFSNWESESSQTFRVKSVYFKSVVDNGFLC